MTAYYNENDPYAAQWLRNLIAAGHIAPGEVDERSILDVRTDDLRGFRQCHFFAGIGVWSYALREAGWPDDREVWTGSCPCQPFSSAGKGQADEDDRHLAPTWLRLIAECRPAVVFGEQVDAAVRVGWLDALFTELEAHHYACGAFSFNAASVGAPHIRQRLYFVADSQCEQEHKEQQRPAADEGERRANRSGGRGMAGKLADTDGRNASAEGLQRGGEHGQQPQDGGAGPGNVGDSDNPRSQGRGERTGTGGSELPARTPSAANGMGNPAIGGGGAQHWKSRPGLGWQEPLGGSGIRGATNGFWSDAEWLPCIDGKARPVEPGTFPLAHGATARVGRLRAYGNAICAPQAAEFVRAYLA